VSCVLRIVFRFVSFDSHLFTCRYLNELLVAANQSKMLKKQQRDTAISDELRRLEQQQLMGQPSPDRLRDLMEKAKAQIVAEVI
jgi:hypothetical protein